MLAGVDGRFIDFLVNWSPYEVETAIVTERSPLRVNYHLQLTTPTPRRSAGAPFMRPQFRG